MSAVKSFYRNFDIDIPNLGKSKHAVPLENHKNAPSKEEIRSILPFASLRNKAIVLCGCSGGLGTSEIINLTVVTEYGLVYQRVYCNVVVIDLLTVRAACADIHDFAFKLHILNVWYIQTSTEPLSIFIRIVIAVFMWDRHLFKCFFNCNYHTLKYTTYFT